MHHLSFGSYNTIHILLVFKLPSNFEESPTIKTDQTGLEQIKLYEIRLNHVLAAHLLQARHAQA